MTSPKTIVIFDYSGTLSIEAPRFGRPENLVRALSETGLAALGVMTPEVFWGEVVGPTWSEGSTTGAGYRALMAAKVRSLQRATDIPEAEIDAACARFVDLYLAHSRIDPGWRPLLSRLTSTPETCGIVATDHYAEATETIVGYLRAWEIPAAALHPGEETGAGPSLQDDAERFLSRLVCDGGERKGERPRKDGTDPFARSDAKAGRAAPPFPVGRTEWLVANSADLGSWKVERRFWEQIRARIFPEAEWRVTNEGGGSPFLPEAARLALKEQGGRPPSPGAVRRILIADDFGFNEESGDLYGQRERVLARRETTAGLLHSVFDAEVEVVPFFLEGDERDSPEAWSRRIGEAAARIDRFLA